MFKVSLLRDPYMFGSRLYIANHNRDKTTVLTDLVWKELKAGESYDGILLLDNQYEDLIRQLSTINNDKDMGEFAGRYFEAQKTIDILSKVLYHNLGIKGK